MGKGSKIDLLVQHGTEIIPIEVKGGEDRTAPSFKHYVTEEQSGYAIRYPKRGCLKNGRITSAPLSLARITRQSL